jgi:hypothetical protein
VDVVIASIMFLGLLVLGAAGVLSLAASSLSPNGSVGLIFLIKD